MAINIPIISSLGGDGFEKAILQLQSLKTNGERAGFVLEKAFLPAIGALGALAVAGGFAVKAAIEDQESQVQLAVALRNTVGATNEVVAATEQMITQMSRASGVADDELRPAFAELVRGTGSIAEATEAMGLAMDISAGTGAELTTVSKALAAAYAGNMKGLKGLSPEITKMIKDGASLSDVIDTLSGNFRGAADAAGRSAKGQLALMTGALTDMKESIGMALLPALEAVIPMLVTFSDWAANHVGVVIGIGTAIAGIATAIATYVAVQKTANAVMIVATALNWAMAASETAKNTAMTLGVGAAAIAAGLVVAMGALVIFKNRTKELTAEQVTNTKATTGQREAIGSTYEMIFRSDRATIKAAYNMAYSTEKIKEAETASGSYSKTLEEQKNKQEAVAKAVKEAAEALKADLVKALQTAQEELEAAKEKFDSFAQTVTESIKEAFSFKDAKDAGEETGAGFLQGLRDQVAGIVDYGKNVKTLLQMGLSEEALKAVLDAGGESGAAIAKELIAGGANAIKETNALVDAANQAAYEIGQSAAAQWYGAGVSNAQEYLKGVTDAFDKAQAKLGQKGLKLPDLKGIAAEFTDSIGMTVATESYSTGQISSNDLSKIGLQAAAGDTYVVNVSSLVPNAAAGEAVINAIRSYNRAAGPANIQVA
jgi:hypothetical protein